MSAAYDLRSDEPTHILPHNLEAEQALLGAVLRNPREALPIARSIVRPDDFFEPVHARIFAVMTDLDRDGRAPSLQILVSALRDDVEIAEGVPVGSYLARVAAQATTVVNVGDYARVVRDLSASRAALSVADGLYEALQGEGALKPFAAVSEAVAQCDALLAAKDRDRPSWAALSDAMDDALCDAERRKANSGAPRISWGLTTLDDMTGGLEPGNLCIIAGRPAMGKTALLASVMLRAARRGHGVVLFSLEMAKPQIALRVACSLASEWSPTAPIDFFKVRRGRHDDDEMRRLRDAWRDAAGLPIVIDDEAGQSVAGIASKVRRYREAMERKGQSLDIVMVDYLGIVEPDLRRSDSKVAEVTDISNGLKRIARQFDVPVVVACQLNRGVEGRDNKRPTMADLRDSGAIEQDADLILFPYREAYYIEREIKRIDGLAKADDRDIDRRDKLVSALAECDRSVEIIVEKQRQGPLGTEKLYADMATGIIRDLERHR